MIRAVEFTAEGTRHTERVVSNSWVHVTRPNDTELALLQECGVSPDLLSHVRDFNERTRVVRRDRAVLIVIHFPYQQASDSAVPYATAPVSLILYPELLVTIEPEAIGVYEELAANPPSGLSPQDRAHFVVDILMQAASSYLEYLQQINLAVEETEVSLQRSLRNQEVLQLLNYQKSLVYFSTALNSIEMMVEKLRKGDFLEWTPESVELAEDAMIEIRQALYQVEIAENILTQMMDAFASIVSNNLNTVMKFLAAITIVISLPMLIGTLYGMNVPLPGGAGPQTFGFLLALSGILAVIVIVVFRKKDWL